MHINRMTSIRCYSWKSTGNAMINMRETLPRYVPGKRNYRESPSKRRRLQGTQDLWIDQGSGQPWMFSPRTMNIQADIDSPCKTSQDEKENRMSVHRHDMKLDFRTFKQLPENEELEQQQPVNSDHCCPIGEHDRDSLIAMDQNQLISTSREPLQILQPQNRTNLGHSSPKEAANKDISENDNHGVDPNPNDSYEDVEEPSYSVGAEDITESVQELSSTDVEELDQNMLTHIVDRPPRGSRSRATTLRSLLCCVLPVDDNLYRVSSCTINALKT